MFSLHLPLLDTWPCLTCTSSPCSEAVGYPLLLKAIAKRLGRAPPPRRLLLSALGLLLEASGGCLHDGWLAWWECRMQGQRWASAIMPKIAGGCPQQASGRLCPLGCLQEAPGAGAAPRFASTAVANPLALRLVVALLRRAAPEDQLWGLAALHELLLQP